MVREVCGDAVVVVRLHWRLPVAAQRARRRRQRALCGRRWLPAGIVGGVVCAPIPAGAGVVAGGVAAAPRGAAPADLLGSAGGAAPAGSQLKPIAAAPRGAALADLGSGSQLMKPFAGGHGPWPRTRSFEPKWLRLKAHTDGEPHAQVPPAL